MSHLYYPNTLMSRILSKPLKLVVRLIFKYSFLWMQFIDYIEYDLGLFDTFIYLKCQNSKTQCSHLIGCLAKKINTNVFRTSGYLSHRSIFP